MDYLIIYIAHYYSTSQFERQHVEINSRMLKFPVMHTFAQNNYLRSENEIIFSMCPQHSV